MAQRDEVTTDRLIGIIANIKMERKSGQLRVQRGEGLASEDGVLTFVQGRVTQARVGRRSGTDAVNWVSTWGQARYIFLPLASDEKPSLAGFSTPSVFPDAIQTDPPAQRADTDDLELGGSQIPASGYEVASVSLSLQEAMARIEQAGLSRAHRRLYLLVDGRRSLSELVPLLGKKVEEVRSMLRDLEWLGVIRMTNLPI